MGPWYEELFDHRYLDFYERLRLLEPAAEDAAFVAEALGLEPGARVLDLGCGTGRHSVALARRGYRVTGVDLSAPLLAAAEEMARRHGATVRLERRDMRDLGGLGPFDACVSMATAFGYLGDPGDAAVLAGVRAALAQDGALLLDLTNFFRTLCHPGSIAWRETAESVNREAHRYLPLEGVLVTSRTRFLKAGGVVRLPDSRVRAYQPHEVAALLGQAGFELVRVFGDLRGAVFQWDRSPQQVYVAAARS